MKDLIKIKEGMVLVPVADLSKLVEKIESLEKQVLRLKPKDNGSDLLTAKDIMKDLGISRKSLDRRLYEWDNPLPMVKEGNKLKIRRDKYEAWKAEIGL